MSIEQGFSSGYGDFSGGDIGRGSSEYDLPANDEQYRAEFEELPDGFTMVDLMPLMYRLRVRQLREALSRIKELHRRYD